MHSKLINTLSAEQINDLEEMSRRYKELDPNTLFTYLWKLTYDPEYALSKLGLVGDEFLQLHKKVRNYLFEEYEKPDILGDPEKYDKELFLALEQDKFAYTYISKKIDEAIYSYPKTELERISNLLSSEMENNQFGGLRSLGLNLSEATYFQALKGSISLIYKLFEKKIQELAQNENNFSDIENMDEKEYNNNFIKSEEYDKSINEVKENKEDKDLINSFISCVNNKKEIFELLKKIQYIESKGFSIIINSSIIKSYEVFMNLFELLDELKKRGVDIEFFADNIEAIEAILERTCQ